MPSINVIISNARLLTLARKCGVLTDFACGHCEAPNDLRRKIKPSDFDASDDFYFPCRSCGKQDLISLEIIEEAVSEYVNDLKIKP